MLSIIEMGPAPPRSARIKLRLFSAITQESLSSNIIVQGQLLGTLSKEEKNILDKPQICH